MKIIKSSILEIIFFYPDNNKTLTEHVEAVARNCYRSEDHISEGSDKALIRRIIKSGHEAMIEFGDIQVKLCTDIGCTREGNRHRHLSIAESSTRYCNYSKDKFNNEIEFIQQQFKNLDSIDVWLSAIKHAEDSYMRLIRLGENAQTARAVLPLCTRTDVVYKGNYREWRHILNLRCAKAAHPTIRNLMLELLQEFYNKIPVVFEDLYNKFYKEEK